ncbi:MAG: MATE family efflux transporter, partial [Clostridia bacterium]
MILSPERDFYKQTIRLTFFIALQNVIVCFVGLADNVMIGAYSQDALSGVALANQFQFLLQMVVGGVGEGMVVIAAQYWGTKRLQPIRRVAGI